MPKQTSGARKDKTEALTRSQVRSYLSQTFGLNSWQAKGLVRVCDPKAALPAAIFVKALVENKGNLSLDAAQLVLSAVRDTPLRRRTREDILENLGFPQTGATNIPDQKMILKGVLFLLRTYWLGHQRSQTCPNTEAT